ncbi:MAG: sensor histidine kinase [Anaerolineae bacterium]|nr:MAG: sensor histidine kinase [Anaerolineae bacterium]
MNLSHTSLGFVYFAYGLAFFAMGLAIILEHARGSDLRLRLALRPFAGFGLIHGLHEWVAMLQHWALVPDYGPKGQIWEGAKLALLAFSFLSLAGFGTSLLAPDLRRRRISLLVPLVMAGIWAFGVMAFIGQYTVLSGLWRVADVWTRYSLGIPASVMASLGLVAQQRAFRHAGMAEFGRDSLMAALGFGWYGLIGQLFGPQSRLVPSTFLNQDLFFTWFGFPVQLFRAALAGFITLFVIRMMRSFDSEIHRQIESLQRARLEEAERRETLRGEQLKRIVDAQEAERQRIARELHDDTGQALTAIGLGLRGVANNLRADPALAAANLARLEALTGRSLDELQRMIRNLRPSHLDDLGLPAALRWYGGELGEAARFEFHFEEVGAARQLPEALKVALFRIAQEALTNIIKHAGAHNVWVTLRYSEHQMAVTVRDDGCGFDPLAIDARRKPSWGLLGMRERAALLNGDFDLQSRPGQGTSITVSIPCPDLPSLIHVESYDDHPLTVD